MTRQSDGRSGHDKRADSRSNTRATLGKACRLVKECFDFQRTSDARDLLVEALRSDRVYSYGRPKLFHRAESKIPYPLAPRVWRLEIDPVRGTLYSRKSQLLVVPTRPQLTVIERLRGRWDYSEIETKVEWIADVRIDLPSLNAFLDNRPRPPAPKPPRVRDLAEKDNPAIRGSSDPEFVRPDDESTEPAQGTNASVGRTRRRLIELMRDGGRKEKPKSDHRQEAMATFKVSQRGFDRAWDAAIKETDSDWNKPGRISSRRIDTPK